MNTDFRLTAMDYRRIDEVVTETLERVCRSNPEHRPSSHDWLRLAYHAIGCSAADLRDHELSAIEFQVEAICHHFRTNATPWPMAGERSKRTEMVEAAKRRATVRVARPGTPVQLAQLLAWPGYRENSRRPLSRRAKVRLTSGAIISVNVDHVELVDRNGPALVFVEVERG